MLPPQTHTNDTKTHPYPKQHPIYTHSSLQYYAHTPWQENVLGNTRGMYKFRGDLESGWSGKGQWRGKRFSLESTQRQKKRRKHDAPPGLMQT